MLRETVASPYGVLALRQHLREVLEVRDQRLIRVRSGGRWRGQFSSPPRTSVPPQLAGVPLAFRSATFSEQCVWEMVEGQLICAIELEDVTICSRPPTAVRMELGQLHSAHGFAVEWADSTGLYFLRGIRIPHETMRRLLSGRLTAQHVLAGRNAEVMSVLMEQLGWRDLVEGRVAGTLAHCEDHDERWGTLWRFSWGGHTADTSWGQQSEMTVLEVVNRSPEPDGSFRHYWLPIHRECRPLGRDGQLGASQSPTSLNAVASTFGLTGAEYEAIIGEES